MMAERLAQMRAEYDSIEGKPNHTVGHIRELLDHIAQLEAQRGGHVQLDADSVHPLIIWTDDFRVRMKETAEAINEWVSQNVMPQVVFTGDDFWGAYGTDHIRDIAKMANEAASRKQRGGAVVVPELTSRDAYEIEMRLAGGNDRIFRMLNAAYMLAVSRIQPIPADRVLEDGMVGVDREELMYLHAFEKYARKHGPESIQDVAGTLDHLRSAQQAKEE